MPVQTINQQSQAPAAPQKNVNLSPDEFNKLLESLRNQLNKPSQSQPADAQATPQVKTPPTTENIPIKEDTPAAPVVKETIPQETPGKAVTDKPSVFSSPSEDQLQQVISPEPSKTPVMESSVKIESNTAVNDSAQSTALIKLGVIDKNTPTVSHLLKNNPQYKKDAWNIIFSEVNKTKEFTKIQKGSTVSINTITNELVWQREPSMPKPMPVIADITPENITSDGKIIIGEISKENPTVSHLLKKNSFYGKYAWNIIFSSVNKSKPYASLTPGKVITIDPQTFELSFIDKKDMPPSNKLSAAAAHTLNSFAIDYFDSNKDFSSRLADSVKSYIGTPYNKMDCYSLIINGLEKQGINYSASGGIRDTMEQLAIEQGLPLNAYQNGEGLVETAGQQVYGKSYTHINDPVKQAQEIYSEISPILKEGGILSFSTPSQGHTGVISRKDSTWSYINSGLIDNGIDDGKIGRRVGEEVLKDELENWFTLAKNKNESLKVSIGLLDENKLNPINNDLVAQRNIKL